MQKNTSRYLLNVYATTIFIGLILGGLLIYIIDKSSGSYSDDWDNPFYTFLLFLLVAAGESIFPLLLFFIIGKVIISRQGHRVWLYMLGFVCTVAPFCQLYYIVNEGYHKTNVMIYAGCFIFALLLTYRLFRSQLTALYD